MRPPSDLWRVSEQSCLFVRPADPIEGRGMPWVRIAPTLESSLDVGIPAALQASNPGRRLAAQHPFGLWQSKRHGSASIQQAVDLGNGLAHLLLDALDG